MPKLRGVTRSSWPALVCDVWEHAYYLKYRNDRSSWVDNFLEMANWSFATERYQAACNVK